MAAAMVLTGTIGVALDVWLMQRTLLREGGVSLRFQASDFLTLAWKILIIGSVLGFLWALFMWFWCEMSFRRSLRKAARA